MMQSMTKLKDEMRELIEENFEEIQSSNYPEDWIYEEADYLVGNLVSTDILDLAKEDAYLAENEPGIETGSPLRSIQYNILRDVEKAGREKFEEMGGEL